MVPMARPGRVVIGHDGGDSGAATVGFFDAEARTGVVALTNGDWRRVNGKRALALIMDRLFDEAPRLDD